MVEATSDGRLVRNLANAKKFEAQQCSDEHASKLLETIS